MKLTFSTLLAVTLTGFAAPALALVIDFEGIVDPAEVFTGSVLPFETQGFVFSDVSTRGLTAVFDETYDIVPINTNGTDVLGWLADSTFRMEAQNGGTFDLSAFDATNLAVNGTPGSFLVTGFLADGSSVSSRFSNVLNTYTSFAVSSDFEDLVAVEFGNFGMISGAIDNLNVTSPAAPVPLGTSLAFATTGAAALSAMRRRRRA
jgi:hypothetical protein